MKLYIPNQRIYITKYGLLTPKHDPFNVTLASLEKNEMAIYYSDMVGS